MTRNLASVSATSTNSSAFTIATATLTANTGEIYQVTGFDGSSGDSDFKLEIKFADTTKVTMYGGSDNPAGRGFGEFTGITSSAGEDVTAVLTLDSAGSKAVNLFAKRMF